MQHLKLKALLSKNDEWKKRLTPEQYRVLREKGTEPPFRNAYFDNKDEGKYFCAGCGQLLFDSKDKYDSGTGWPSFKQPASQESILYRKDNDLYDSRLEVLCSQCECHLGHVFDDGPAPTGKRFCMNSTALKFQKKP